MSLNTLATALLLAVTLYGCGQMGPLYMPTESPETADDGSERGDAG